MTDSGCQSSNKSCLHWQRTGLQSHFPKQLFILAASKSEDMRKQGMVSHHFLFSYFGFSESIKSACLLVHLDFQIALPPLAFAPTMGSFLNFECLVGAGCDNWVLLSSQLTVGLEHLKFFLLHFLSSWFIDDTFLTFWQPWLFLPGVPANPVS